MAEFVLGAEDLRAAVAVHVGQDRMAIAPVAPGSGRPPWPRAGEGRAVGPVDHQEARVGDHDLILAVQVQVADRQVAGVSGEDLRPAAALAPIRLEDMQAAPGDQQGLQFAVVVQVGQGQIAYGRQPGHLAEFGHGPGEGFTVPVIAGEGVGGTGTAFDHHEVLGAVAVEVADQDPGSQGRVGDGGVQVGDGDGEPGAHQGTIGVPGQQVGDSSHVRHLPQGYHVPAGSGAELRQDDLG